LLDFPSVAKISSTPWVTKMQAIEEMVIADLKPIPIWLASMKMYGLHVCNK